MKYKEASNIKNLLIELVEVELDLNDDELKKEMNLNNEKIESIGSSIRSDMLSYALEYVSKSDNKHPVTRPRKSSYLKKSLNKLMPARKSAHIYAKKKGKKKHDE